MAELLSPLSEEAEYWRPDSVNFQSDLTKFRARALNDTLRRRIRILQLVVETERLPFKAAHLMERQNVNSLYHPKLCSKPGDIRYIAQVIGQPGYQHISQPYGPAQIGKAPGESQDGIQIHACESTVQFPVPRLDIEQHQAYRLQVVVSEPLAEESIRVKRRMDAHALSSRKQLQYKAVLHQGFAAADS